MPRVFYLSRPSLIPDPDAFAEQKQLVEAAIHPDAETNSPRAVSEVCATAGVEEAAFERHFESVEELQPAFYDLTLAQYRMLTEATTGYEDFSFEERLASFYYILLDALGEQ